jgi:MFS family permease
MDHLGAAVGPLCASGLLLLWPGRFRLIFALAAIPGALAVLALFSVREQEQPPAAPSPDAHPAEPASAEGRHPTGLLTAIALFTLGNSADSLLLLRAQALGVSTTLLPILWVVLHAVRAGTSWPLGRLADQLGRRGSLVTGWLWYAICYAGFAFARKPEHAWILFAAYGLVAGLTEGSERALVAEAAPPGKRGSALGLYNLVSGIGLLIASVLAGTVWERVSAPAALGLGATLAVLAAATLVLVRTNAPRQA